MTPVTASTLDVKIRGEHECQNDRSHDKLDRTNFGGVVTAASIWLSFPPKSHPNLHHRS